MAADEPAFTRLNIRVTPRSSRPGVEIDADGLVHVRVAAAPAEGAANEAIIRVLSEALGLPKSRIKIDRGQTSRHKQVLIDMSAEELRMRLGRPD